MIIVDNKVVCESHVLTCDSGTLKKQATVLKKIKFSDSEKSALDKVGFDFANLENLVATYGESKDESDLDNVKFASPVFLYFRQRKENAESVIVAIAVEGQIYLNKNVDNDLGFGAEATRLKHCAYLNGFIDCFSATESDVQTFDGQPFKVEKSALDNRRQKKQSDDSCLDW